MTVCWKLCITLSSNRNGKSCNKDIRREKLMQRVASWHKSIFMQNSLWTYVWIHTLKRHLPWLHVLALMVTCGATWMSLFSLDSITHKTFHEWIYTYTCLPLKIHVNSTMNTCACPHVKTWNPPWKPPSPCILVYAQANPFCMYTRVCSDGYTWIPLCKPRTNILSMDTRVCPH